MILQPTLDTLDAALSEGSNLIPAFKEANKSAISGLTEAFENNIDVVDLVHARSQFVDGLLQRLWRIQDLENQPIALVAVGGYGRGELHPASDVDVLILCEKDPQEYADRLEPLVALFWDIGLDIGHSVRSLEQCVEEAGNDITIATNLLESRLLIGNEDLFSEMRELTDPDHIWPSDAFFSAKWEEQISRHAKFDDSSANLEPNVKSSPGGLRDIQMIGWVAKYHFRADRLSELVTHRFLTEREYHSLKEGTAYLWKVRFALHILTGRHEDRLLFEHQRALAKQFGYNDENTNLAVEQFMQDYYRRIVTMQRLNEMLLQLFQEAILLKNTLAEPVVINKRFQTRNDYLEITNPGTFARYPLAMMELFHIMQENPSIKGVRASTIRLVREHRHLIDARFRRSLPARSMFMEIMRQPQGLTHAIRRMHRYGILGRYLPAFGKITGLMQFDLFHVYTVDEHIMMVIRTMRRFSLDLHADECARCNDVYKKLPKPELLYITGLFHDIAKGRNGDHSVLGMEDARQFCEDHGLSNYDAELVVWLVQKHLLMSHVAQHTDIDDPEVIQSFAKDVGNKIRLNYLYLLTVADMRGTNPQRWNSWKGSLMDRLHTKTLALFERGIDRQPEEDEIIQQHQDKARKRLIVAGIPNQQINLIWMNLSTEYFLQNSTDAIVWHTEKLINTDRNTSVYHIHLRHDEEHGCNEVFIFGPDKDDLFAHTTALLDKVGLNILRASVHSTPGAMSMNSYFVLEEDGSAIKSGSRTEEILGYFNDGLNENNTYNPESSPRIPRQLKSFTTPSSVTFDIDNNKAVTIMNLRAIDRPGLLSRVGAVFSAHELRIHGARIATAGEVAKDSFALSDRKDFPITDQKKLNMLARDITEILDNQLN